MSASSACGRFSFADDERLVNVIREFPIIYNPDLYGPLRSHDVLIGTWNQVAEAVGRNREACKKRWRDMRDHFFKVIKKQQAGKQRLTKWPLYEKLLFLKNVKRKIRNGNVDVEVSETEGSMDVYETEPPVKVEATDYLQPDSPSQIEYMNTSGIPTESENYINSAPHDNGERPLSLMEALADRPAEDDVDVFMRSVALTIKRFPPKIRAEAKLKILSLVTQLEFPEHKN